MTPLMREVWKRELVDELTRRTARIAELSAQRDAAAKELGLQRKEVERIRRHLAQMAQDGRSGGREE